MTQPRTIFNEADLNALRFAMETLRRTSNRISERYEVVERTGDYSDADEFGADDREHLHEVFESLMDHFSTNYPSLFDKEES
ncbi:hypothetical protein SEA_BLINN1_85 [Mycobacterium phage Blinn1]|uniref:Uncharacterized protein n=1 Tax=Mycobacterium phage Blinn1 TaxID=2656562 RepID=A0A649VS64_9CAUD|nr:hypothetical protein KIP53_gp024 [Mycobacterium phage Blinn1]QGJ94845.1 hypothetical protein SEA_BLINN1_85 [Mycobacterium phage Blinn1]